MRDEILYSTRTSNKALISTILIGAFFLILSIYIFLTLSNSHYIILFFGVISLISFSYLFFVKRYFLTTEKIVVQYFILRIKREYFIDDILKVQKDDYSIEASGDYHKYTIDSGKLFKIEFKNKIENLILKEGDVKDLEYFINRINSIRKPKRQRKSHRVKN